MRYFFLIGIIALISVVLVELKVLYFSGDVSEGTTMGDLLRDKPIDLLKEGDIWAKRIDEVGVVQAYEEFKKVFASLDFGTQHAAIHIFGEVLYKSEGISGLVVCDSTFSFGCYHSFFLAALSEHGKEIVSDMDRACIEKYGVGGVGCQHGIGHGLVEYLGPDRIVEALNTCATLAWKRPLFGCQGGVFMEYTIPTIFDSENSVLSVKDIDEKNPYDICPELPDKYHQACYYSLGQWWKKFFNYKKIGSLCKEIENKESREACYLGVGSIVAPSNNYNISEAIDSCKKMPDFEGELVCRAGASWAFFALPQMRSDSLKLCEGFQDADSEHLCAQKSDLVGERNL